MTAAAGHDEDLVAGAEAAMRCAVCVVAMTRVNDGGDVASGLLWLLG